MHLPTIFMPSQLQLSRLQFWTRVGEHDQRKTLDNGQGFMEESNSLFSGCEMSYILNNQKIITVITLKILLSSICNLLLHQGGADRTLRFATSTATWSIGNTIIIIIAITTIITYQEHIPLQPSLQSATHFFSNITKKQEDMAHHNMRNENDKVNKSPMKKKDLS